jgi:hypothetical protein
MAHKVISWTENMKERNSLDDMDIDGTKKFKCLLKEYDVRK